MRRDLVINMSESSELNKKIIKKIEKAKKRIDKGQFVTEEEARKRIFKK